MGRLDKENFSFSNRFDKPTQTKFDFNDGPSEPMTDATKNKIAGATLLGAAAVSQGFADRANSLMNVASIERRQREVSQRADIAIGHLIEGGQKVRAVQETSFAKAGVKLEGSALNVLAETADNAMEAARVKQREADFENSQREQLKAVSKVNAKYAMFNTILGAAGQIGAASAGGK